MERKKIKLKVVKCKDASRKNVNIKNRNHRNHRKHKRFFSRNFLSGLYRGFGMAIGFTILTAVVIYLLQRIVMLNLPIVSEFIGKIVKLVDYYVRAK